MKYRLTRPPRPIDRPDVSRPTALVWIQGDDHDTDGALHIEGDATLAEQIRDALFLCYGNRARPMSDCVSPRDLAVALDSERMRPFEPVPLD